MNGLYWVQLPCSSFARSQLYEASKLAVDGYLLNQAYIVRPFLILLHDFEYKVLGLFHKSAGQLS